MKQVFVVFDLILQTDTKSTVQAHTVCTTQIDQNRHNRMLYNSVGGRTTTTLS